MRWYVSRDGETVGPVEESEVVEWVREGMTDAMLRDEASPHWIEVAQSPFAKFIPPPPEPKPHWTQNLNWWQSLLIVGGVVFGVGAFQTLIRDKGRTENTPVPAEPKKPKPEHSKIEAWVIAQQFVKQQLKSPGTASFGSLMGDTQSYDKQCDDLGQKTYSCHGWVDAQNSFGATIRNNWTITVTYVGDGNWRAVEGPVLLER